MSHEERPEPTAPALAADVAAALHPAASAGESPDTLALTVYWRERLTKAFIEHFDHTNGISDDSIEEAEEVVDVVLRVLAEG